MKIKGSSTPGSCAEPCEEVGQSAQASVQLADNVREQLDNCAAALSFGFEMSAAMANANNSNNNQTPGDDSEEAVEAEQAPVAEEQDVAEAEQAPDAAQDAEQAAEEQEQAPVEEEEPAADDDDVRTMYSDSIATKYTGQDSGSLS